MRWVAPTEKQTPQRSIGKAPEGREEERIEFSWAGETARHIGTVVHRCLQRIAGDELKGWTGWRAWPP